MHVSTLFRPLTAAEFQEMAEKGLFAPGVRLELMEGRIELLPPVGQHHAALVNRIAEYFFVTLGQRYSYSIQNPLLLLDDSQPQPDLMVLRRDEDFYADAPPTAQDALLVVEVSDSTLERDVSVKAPLSARAGIPELWIVNVIDGVLIQFHTPQGDRCAHQRTFQPGEEMRTTVNLTVPVSAIIAQ